MSEQTKGKPVWLCRRRAYGQDNDYVISPKKKPPDKFVYGIEVLWIDELQYRVCARQFKSIFGYHPLKPGEGPIKVRLSLEVVE